MYDPGQIESLRRDFHQVTRGLQDVLFEGASQAEAVDNDGARLYLQHGVGRRVSVLKKSIEKIFHLFPLDQTEVLGRDVVADVQIYLHAFVVNVYGVFDNWAWAFIYRHALFRRIGDKQHVGMFKKQTQALLPAVLRDYLSTGAISTWHQQYLKSYRDELAHRIPLYIPPALWTPEDQENYRRLESEKVRLIREHEWDRLDEVWNEQDRIGAPCPMFMHEFPAEGNSRTIYLHPQVLCDGMTVVDFGKRFYEAWHDHE